MDEFKNDDEAVDDTGLPDAGAVAAAAAAAVAAVSDGTPPEQEMQTPAPKERHSLTLDQRRSLRRWANTQMVRPSHKACIEWFSAQYGLTISQSTVSHSLSPKYARLDGDPQLSGSRLRFGNWPDVEKLVLLWHTESVAHGRHPTNEELADKAKAIFTQLPRYKGEPPPEFSPGWIHRFKKRYGLLMRRQRRSGNAGLDTANDLAYLVDTLPRLMSVAPDTSPALIRDTIERVIGIEVSLANCARVRDDVLRVLPQPHMAIAAAAVHAAAADPGAGDPQHHQPPPPPPPPPDHQDDPEVALQNALRAIQQEEDDAEAEAAAAREHRERMEQDTPPLRNGVVGPGGAAAAAVFIQQQQQQQQQQPPANPGLLGTPTPNRTQHSPVQFRDSEELKLTPIQSSGHVLTSERPVRCPFCVNPRMLRSIKESVEHLSTHVVV